MIEEFLSGFLANFAASTLTHNLGKLKNIKDLMKSRQKLTKRELAQYDACFDYDSEFRKLRKENKDILPTNKQLKNLSKFESLLWAVGGTEKHQSAWIELLLAHLAVEQKFSEANEKIVYFLLKDSLYRRGIRWKKKSKPKKTEKVS